jgi:hypothetical protein
MQRKEPKIIDLILKSKVLKIIFVMIVIIIRVKEIVLREEVEHPFLKIKIIIIMFLKKASGKTARGHLLPS